MNLVIAPILLPLFTALIAMLWERSSASRRVFIAISAVAQLVVALLLVVRVYHDGIMVLTLGGWAAPYGIVLVIDLLAAVMLSLCTITSLAAVLYSFAEDPIKTEHPLRLPLMQMLVMGINISFATGDLFNLFVGFEVMLISSYALLTLESNDFNVKQAFPYLAVNMFASALFLCGAGFCYGIFGTLNFADIAAMSPGFADDPRVLGLGFLLMLVFSVKAGLFPLYYWLPNSYPILPFAISALYSGMLTKVGVYVLIRVFGTVMPHELTLVHTWLAWLAGFTMIFGVFGAISRNYIRGILSYHILSQIGYMVLAIGFFTRMSIAAAIFYVVHHIIVKSSLFLIGGAAAHVNRTDDLDRMGNLWRLTPLLGVLFLFQALSLAGMPPLSGFWGKYLIISEGLKLGEHRPEMYVLVAASLAASIFTLFSMLKIWMGAFWNEREDQETLLSDGKWKRLAIPAGMMTLVSIGIMLGAEVVMDISITAANSIMDRQPYIEAVRAAGGISGS